MPSIDFESTNSEETTILPGTLCELMVVDETYDQNGKLVVTPKVESGEDEEDDTTAKIARHAIVQRRKFNSSNELTSSKVDINSPHILKSLATAISFYPRHPGYFREQVTVRAPYMILHHHWAALEEYRDTLAEFTVE